MAEVIKLIANFDFGLAEIVKENPETGRMTYQWIEAESDYGRDAFYPPEFFIDTFVGSARASDEDYIEILEFFAMSEEEIKQIRDRSILYNSIPEYLTKALEKGADPDVNNHWTLFKANSLVENNTHFQTRKESIKDYFRYKFKDICIRNGFAPSKDGLVYMQDYPEKREKTREGTYEAFNAEYLKYKNSVKKESAHTR